MIMPFNLCIYLTSLVRIGTWIYSAPLLREGYHVMPCPPRGAASASPQDICGVKAPYGTVWQLRIRTATTAGSHEYGGTPEVLRYSKRNSRMPLSIVPCVWFGHRNTPGDTSAITIGPDPGQCQSPTASTSILTSTTAAALNLPLSLAKAVSLRSQLAGYGDPFLDRSLYHCRGRAGECM